MTVKYWEGRTPPEDYYVAPDPYRSPQICRIDHQALSQYSRETGKPVPDMSYEEVEQFAVSDDELKVSYINGVKETLIEMLGLSETEAERAIDHYDLLYRLEVAPDIQLHTDYKDVVADMQRKGCIVHAE